MTYRIERINANKAGSLKRSTKLQTFSQKKREDSKLIITIEIKSVVLT